MALAKMEVVYAYPPGVVSGAVLASRAAAEASFKEAVKRELLALGVVTKKNKLVLTDAAIKAASAPNGTASSTAADVSEDSASSSSPSTEPSKPLTSAQRRDFIATKCALLANGTKSQNGLVTSLNLTTTRIPSFPDTWSRCSVVKCAGKGVGRIEHSYVDQESGKRFRSINEARNFLETGKLPVGRGGGGGGGGVSGGKAGTKQ
jgi:hypothetical protein